MREYFPPHFGAPLSSGSDSGPVLFLFGSVERGSDAFCHGYRDNTTQYYGTQHKCTHQPIYLPYFVHTYCAHTHMGCSPLDFSTFWALHGLLNNMSVLYIAIISRGSRNIFWSFARKVSEPNMDRMARQLQAAKANFVP